MGLARENGYCVMIATDDINILSNVDVVYRMNRGVLHIGYSNA